MLRAGRPVLVSLTLRWQEWRFLGRFFENNKRHAVLTRAIYNAQPESEDTRWGPCEHHAVLWTGYDPVTGACTFINPPKPKRWGNNGAFKVEDIDLLMTIMPMSELRFYEFYCHPGNVIKRNRFVMFVKLLLEDLVLPGQSLVPNPFAEYQEKEKKKKVTKKKTKKKKNPWPGSFATRMASTPKSDADRLKEANKRSNRRAFQDDYNSRVGLDMLGFDMLGFGLWTEIYRMAI